MNAELTSIVPDTTLVEGFAYKEFCRNSAALFIFHGSTLQGMPFISKVLKLVFLEVSLGFAPTKSLTDAFVS